MPRSQFNELNERLLRAGIAPRHVRRYVAELRDHFDDLVREETEKGSKQEIAEDVARTRIGSDDELAAVMLAKPGLRSLTARFPWAAFGIGPVLMLALAVLAATLTEGGLLHAHLGFFGARPPATPPGWIKSLTLVWNCLITYAAPLMTAALLCVLGIRQRMSGRWVAFGAAIVCILGAFHEVAVVWADVPGVDRSYIGVTFALAPPFPQWLITEGLFRMTINVALVAAGYWLLLRQMRDRALQ